MQGGTIPQITAPQSKHVLVSTEVEAGTQKYVNYYPTMKMIWIIFHLKRKFYVYCLSGRQRKSTEEMGRSDPGNLKLSRVRLKSVILIMMNYTLLYRQFAWILSARHTSAVFIMCWLAEGWHWSRYKHYVTAKLKCGRHLSVIFNATNLIRKSMPTVYTICNNK